MPEPPTPPVCTVMTVPKIGTECTPGELRLQDGSSDSIIIAEGRLEYCTDGGLWTAFCNIDEVAASTACRQLGYTKYDSKLHNT